MAFEQGNLLIAWQESNLTGVNILDEQHRGIVSIINALHYLRFVHSHDAFLEPIVDMITGYTKIHFQVEMEMLHDSGYPKFQEHQGQHDHLIAESERVFRRCLREGGDPGPYLEFLKDWWLVHINQEDMAYSGHLLEYFQSGRRVIIRRG